MLTVSLALSLILTLTQASVPAHARAEALLRRCTGQGSPDSTSAKALEAACVAYIGGVMEGLRLTQLELSNKESLACLPTGGISFDQARRVVVKFMQDNPQLLHEHQGSVAVAALMTAYPCPGR